MKLDTKKFQLAMAELCMNPYDVCSKADIAYASYRRIMNTGSCKIGTLGKLAKAVNKDVTEIIED